MHISGTEPSSVIRSQTKYSKSWKCPKKPKQAETKRDGVINSLEFNQF